MDAQGAEGVWREAGLWENMPSAATTCGTHSCLIFCSQPELTWSWKTRVMRSVLYSCFGDTGSCGFKSAFFAQWLGLASKIVTSMSQVHTGLWACWQNNCQKLISAVGSSVFGHVCMWDAATRQMAIIRNVSMLEAQLRIVQRLPWPCGQNPNAQHTMAPISLSGPLFFTLGS